MRALGLVYGLQFFRLKGGFMKQMPTISKYMTPMPHTVGKDIPISKALEIIREYRIRHLPVQDGGVLVGVVTDRDVKLAASFGGTSDLKCEDVMTSDPFTVKPETEVSKVAEEMAEHKYGCAIIQQSNGKVVGIFTATDGMRVLGEVLNQNYKH